MDIYEEAQLVSGVTLKTAGLTTHDELEEYRQLAIAWTVKAVEDAKGDGIDAAEAREFLANFGMTLLEALGYKRESVESWLDGLPEPPL